ncbi:PAS domain-containing protein [Myxococcaceae bacterium GXIMD 01537]
MTAAADTSAELLAFVGPDERYRFTNRAFDEWHHLARGACRGRTVREVLGEATYEALRPAVRAALSGQRMRFERVVSRDGAQHHLEITYVPHLRADGSVAGYVTTARDLTERRQLEERNQRLTETLEAERRLLRGLLELLPVGVNVRDAAGALMLSNTRAMELLERPVPPEARYEEPRLLRMNGQPFPSEEWPHARALRGEYVPEEDGLWVLADGSRRVLRSSAGPILDARGRQVAAVTVLRDVSARHRMAEERERSQHLLAAVLDQLPVAVLIADAATGRRVLSNRELERLWRHGFRELGDLEDWPGWKGFRPDGTEYAREDWPLARALEEGEVVAAEVIRVRRGDGTWGEHEVSAAPVRDGAGNIVAAVATMLDVTDRRREAAELESAASFSEQLLGVVSHDLRNPLSAILLSANVLLRAGGLDERQTRALARVARSASGMDRMIKDLLDFTRARLGGGFPLHPEPTHLELLCAEVLEELEIAHPTRELRSRLVGGAAGQWDRYRLAQVVSNLVGNALKYSPAHTPVTVTTAPGGTHMLLEVHNAGRPIPPEVLPGLFEPFRRGHSSAGPPGLGLGLYIAHEIVRAHGGTVEVRSTEGEGTTFTVRLPLPPGLLAG